MLEWKLAVQELQAHQEASSSSSRAFLAATETVLVALYDLVCLTSVLKSYSITR
jgi:hypothetical protein